jgi:glycosyltransferase 2 family protein
MVLGPGFYLAICGVRSLDREMVHNHPFCGYICKKAAPSPHASGGPGHKQHYTQCSGRRRTHKGIYAGKYANCPLEKSFATVIADRGLDTFPFVVLAVITIIFAVLYLKLSFLVISALIISLLALVIAFAVALYMSVDQKMGERVTRWLLKILKRFSKKEHSKIERKALSAMNGFQNSIRTLLKNRKVLLYGLPLSFLIWFLEILRVYLVFSAFDVQVNLGLIAAVFVIATLIGMIPLHPGGMGAVDGMMILFFSLAGIPPSVSAAATIVERLISFWMTSFLGITLLPYLALG